MGRHGSNRGHKHLDQASCLVKNHCLLVKSASSPKIHVCLSKSVSQHINLLHHVSKFHMSRYGTCLKTKQGKTPCKRWHLRCIYFHTPFCHCLHCISFLLPKNHLCFERLIGFCCKYESKYICIYNEALASAVRPFIGAKPAKSIIVLKAPLSAL